MQGHEHAKLVRRIQERIHALLGTRLIEQQARQREALSRMGRGTSMPTGSCSASAIRDSLGIAVPSELADADTVAAIKDIVETEMAASDLAFDVTEDVRGGSNYVLRGRISPAPIPAPGM